MLKKFLLALALFLPCIASAQTLKIGLVNTQDVIVALPEFTAAQNTLKEMQTKIEGQFKELETEMSKLMQEYDAMPQTELKAIRDRKAKDIQDLQQKAQIFEQQASQELQQKQEELFQPIFTKVRGAIESVGREGGYSLIQENSAQSVYYFANPVEDITPLVKAKLNIK
ncbi:MAG: OmpH family outer membrane protein [Clostridium sp.]|nr:OmpH family outer membrane protein [Prevotella sp.]MCM1429543.1 OmpH family outer membrane protein [Clostridium sp.]MCM1476049.1 OmpH family outer membrane protein [Muribaculaceae bacterium]